MAAAAYIIEVVARLSKKYKTRDPHELCRALGIKIYYKDLQQKLKGFFFCQSRQKNIVIDSSVNSILEKILLAHELGHAVLHTEIALLRGFQELEILESRQDMPEENEANLFAAELLLEDKTVLEHLGEESFFEAARSLYVPAALLDYKFMLLRAKGYRLNPLDIHRADFLKEDLGTYEDPQRLQG